MKHKFHKEKNMPLQKDKDIWKENLTEEERKEAEQKLREYLDTMKNK